MRGPPEHRAQPPESSPRRVPEASAPPPSHAEGTAGRRGVAAAAVASGGFPPARCWKEEPSSRPAPARQVRPCPSADSPPAAAGAPLPSQPGLVPSCRATTLPWAVTPLKMTGGRRAQSGSRLEPLGQGAARTRRAITVQAVPVLGGETRSSRSPPCPRHRLPKRARVCAHEQV